MSRSRPHVLAFAALLLAVLAFAASDSYNEPFRPRYHYTPAHSWANDPNGLLWYKGEWHLFYQNNPFAITVGNGNGHLSWGHAVSTDLIHWTQLPVAIPDEKNIHIFSGSAVVDYHNTSGLCRNPSHDENSCLVALYTGATWNGKDYVHQDQNVAFSNDKGRHWTKYNSNPVIDLHLRDFRDPKVIWHGPSQSWIMAVALPNEHKVRLYRSRNLREWTKLSDFGPAGATGGQYECPDLFELHSPAGKPKWVLVVNVNPGGRDGGSAAQYFVGDFDGVTFTNDNPASTTLWQDWGKDFYAATTFFNAPPGDENRYQIAWLSNWQYATRTPETGFRGMMDIPRVLTLRQERDGLRLIQQPVKQLDQLRESEVHASGSIEAVNGYLQGQRLTGRQLDIELSIDPADASEFGLHIAGATIGISIGANQDDHIFIDRDAPAFDPNFPGRHTAPLTLTPHQPVALRILLDASSLEVFAQDGAVTLTDRIFPTDDTVPQFYSKSGNTKITAAHFWKMKSIWE